MQLSQVAGPVGTDSGDRDRRSARPGLGRGTQTAERSRRRLPGALALRTRHYCCLAEWSWLTCPVEPVGLEVVGLEVEPAPL